MRDRERSQRQRGLRARRGERAYVFDKDLTACLGEASRDEWEDAISMFVGDVAEAAKLCGLGEIPRSARALWGRSKEEALATYRTWQKRRSR